MKATFDRRELMAGLAELEKCILQHTPSGRLAAAPSSQLDIDLAALLTSAKSGGAPKAVAVDDVVQLADVPPDQAAASDSATIDLAPDKDLRPSSCGKNSVSSRPHRWIYAPAAIVIVMGSLVGGTGYFAGVKVLAALQALRAPREFDPPSQTTAQAPAVEQTTGAEPETPAAAEQTSSSAAPVAETPPAPEASSVAFGVKASAEQPAALVAQPPASAAVGSTPLVAVASPPAAAKTLTTVDPYGPAGASSKPKARVAETTQLVKKRKKAPADKSQTREPGREHHAKSRPARVAKHRGVPDTEPAVIADARRVTQTINGVIQSWVGADPHALH